MGKKGFTVTTDFLVIMIFVIVAAMILFLFFSSFTAEAGGPTSSIFYQFLDWIGNLVF